MVKAQKLLLLTKELFATERVGENAELRARIAGLTFESGTFVDSSNNQAADYYGSN